MLEALLGIMSSGGIGAIVGLIGSFATKYVEFKVLDKKLFYEKEAALIRVRELELEHAHALAVADKQLDIALVEGRIQQDVASMDAFKESQKAAMVMYGGWVDKWRGAMRPTITTYLLVITTVITFLIWTKVGGIEGLTKEQTVSLFVYLVESAVFLTITAVTWWFGTRPSEYIKGRTP